MFGGGSMANGDSDSDSCVELASFRGFFLLIWIVQLATTTTLLEEAQLEHNAPRRFLLSKLVTILDIFWAFFGQKTSTFDLFFGRTTIDALDLEP